MASFAPRTDAAAPAEAAVEAGAEEAAAYLAKELAAIRPLAPVWRAACGTPGCPLPLSPPTQRRPATGWMRRVQLVAAHEVEAAAEDGAQHARLDAGLDLGLLS